MLFNIFNINIDIEYMDITEINISDIYKNTMQTIINIINDITFLINDDTKYMNYNEIIQIFIKNDRMFYMGIIFIILSFVIYFIDGVSI
jgi:hypothetical protein